MNYAALLFLITSSLFSQRLKTNSVQKVQLISDHKSDSLHTSVRDYQTQYRYSTVKVKSASIKKEGSVHLSLSWLKIRLGKKMKHMNEELKSRVKSKDYNSSKLIDYVYEYDCHNYKILNLNIKAKIKDPLDDLKGEPTVTYKNKFINQIHYIDTKEFCNGFVPEELILSTK